MRRFEFWSPSTNLSRRPMHVSVIYRFSLFDLWYHCVALDVEGRCYTWGRNEKGQLGHGDMIQRDRPTKENKQLDTEIHMNYIYDVHVSNYMKMLNEDQPEKFQTHFSQYLKKGVDSEGMEELVIVLVL
ncbi:hypothetical protein F2Q69_00052577 [Brassica cretica]|uniref:Uncharacterized protein n=1 Tax=Brassica cretica TaxID=69181 RepID=A0A8S9N2S0_BRACR|nr:hypothetical protein F2Q69_00052577 [Brassica cretica]